MKPAAALLSLVAAATLSPAFAQAPGAGEPVPGRYQFQSVEGGLARLDTATGEIVFCRVDPARLACAAEPASTPESGPAAATPPRPSAAQAEEEEFERALGRMKRVFRAFGDIARDFDREPPAATAPAPNRT